VYHILLFKNIEIGAPTKVNRIGAPIKVYPTIRIVIKLLKVRSPPLLGNTPLLGNPHALIRKAHLLENAEAFLETLHE
jgi:hypothetical protein